jgi:lipid II:glycine glycyltransferase (peptidoglycan interpeptide bridge formation enzyme)
MFPELLGTAREIADRERCDALEIRMRDDAAVFEDERFHRLDAFVTSVVPLDPDPEKVWSAFRDRHCRREVRQAGRKGLQARQGGAADLAPFHRLLQLTKKKHGVPVQPFSFFRNLWNEFHPRDMIRIFVAELEGRPVSSLITLRQGEKQYAAYMGTDGRFMSYRPNSLLLWTAMEWGCRAGCRSFDFLRSERADERLRYFKSRWRAEEVGLSYYYYPEIKGTAATVERSLKYRLLTGLLRRSPTFVSRAVGRLLYPHLG